jgi:HAD superfamily hydrolase (TIGR01549 family)
MALDIGKVRVVIFDVDGTLRDTDDQYVQRLARWLSFGGLFPRQGGPHSLARWIVMRTESPANFFYGLPDRLQIDDELVRLGNAFQKLGLKRNTGPFIAIPGVPEMLKSLYQHFPLAVASARGERATLAFINHFELASFFKHIATAQTCRYTKPYPDPILWVAEQAGVPPESCLMVGDTVIDIRAGKAAGAQTVGVLCGFGEEKELQRAGADLILPQTMGLAAVLLGEQGSAA